MQKKEHVKKLQSEAYPDDGDWKGQVVEINRTTGKFRILWTSHHLPTEEMAHKACEKWAKDNEFEIQRATDEE